MEGKSGEAANTMCWTEAHERREEELKAKKKAELAEKEAAKKKKDEERTKAEQTRKLDLCKHLGADDQENCFKAEETSKKTEQKKTEEAEKKAAEQTRKLDLCKRLDAGSQETCFKNVDIKKYRDHCNSHNRKVDCDLLATGQEEGAKKKRAYVKGCMEGKRGQAAQKECWAEAHANGKVEQAEKLAEKKQEIKTWQQRCHDRDKTKTANYCLQRARGQEEGAKKKKAYVKNCMEGKSGKAANTACWAEAHKTREEELKEKKKAEKAKEALEKKKSIKKYLDICQKSDREDKGECQGVAKVQEEIEKKKKAYAKGCMKGKSGLAAQKECWAEAHAKFKEDERNKISSFVKNARAWAVAGSIADAKKLAHNPTKGIITSAKATAQSIVLAKKKAIRNILDAWDDSVSSRTDAITFHGDAAKSVTSYETAMCNCGKRLKSYEDKHCVKSLTASDQDKTYRKCLEMWMLIDSKNPLCICPVSDGTDGTCGVPLHLDLYTGMVENTMRFSGPKAAARKAARKNEENVKAEAKQAIPKTKESAEATAVHFYNAKNKGRRLLGEGAENVVFEWLDDYDGDEAFKAWVIDTVQKNAKKDEDGDMVWSGRILPEYGQYVREHCDKLKWSVTKDGVKVVFKGLTKHLDGEGTRRRLLSRGDSSGC